MSAEGSSRRGETKQRMLDGAVQLLRERGAAGVTVDAVLARSGAPRGSVYHHFPGGREEMILGAVRQAGDYITAHLQSAAATGDARRALETFVIFWKRALTDSGFHAGCPVVALAIDNRLDTPQAATLITQIFAAWHEAVTRLLTDQGIEQERAERLATLVVAAVEGAVILCRARHSADPLDDVLAELLPLLGS